MATIASAPLHAKRIRADPIPNIQNAGKIIATGGTTADHSIRPEVHAYINAGNTGTPPHIKKYRKLNNASPGQIIVHPGLQVGQPNLPGAYIFGKKTQFSDPVKEIVKAQNQVGLAAYFQEAKEDQYASHTREPLGKGYSRAYNWPEHAQGVAFGIKYEPVPDQAKNAIYPMGGSLEEREEVKQMYKKTHGNWGPGEQRRRDYVWDSDKFGDVHNHVFGYGEKRLLNGAQNAVMPERAEESYPKTVIVRKTVEDVKAVQNDMLGTVKNLGQGQTVKPSTHIYGYKGAIDPWNAAKCINGEPMDGKEIDHDKDLGRSMRLNCTNTVRKPEHANRAFGCPTIRTDIPFKDKRSITDFQNYGDEPEAVDLLFPSTFVELGVSEWDFAQPRSRQQIQELFTRIGYQYKIGKFNTIFNKAREITGTQNDMASVRAFMTAVKMFHDVQ